MKSISKLYDVVDRTTKTSLVPEPTFNREVARGLKLLLKQQGLDAVIQASKLQVVNTQIIR